MENTKIYGININFSLFYYSKNIEQSNKEF